ncbi:FYN-binding protein 1 isoform X2 [Ascaphus truei]
MEDLESNPPFNTPGRPVPKVGIQARKAALEKLTNATTTHSASGVTSPKKPESPKLPRGLKPLPEQVKPSFPKPSVGVNRLGSSFHAPNKETDGRGVFPKPSGFKPSDLHKEEPKVLFPKPTGTKPYIGNSSQQYEHKIAGIKPSLQPEQQENEEKLTFPKPSALRGVIVTKENESKPTFPPKIAVGPKPSLNLNVCSSENNFKKNAFVPKTYSSSQDVKPFKSTKESTEGNEASSPSPPSFLGVTLKSASTSGVKSIQSPFFKQNLEENVEGTKPHNVGKDFMNKLKQDDNNSRPVATKFPRLQPKFIADQGPSFLDKLKEEKDPSEPKRKPLQPLFKLGPAPQKPSRPPFVDLERIKSTKGYGSSKGVSNEQKTTYSSALSTVLPPPPTPYIPVAQGGPPPTSSFVAKQPPPSTFLPNLPPRNIRPIESVTPADEDNYDDIEHEGHSTAGNDDEISLEGSEEFYEGIDEESVQNRREQEAKKDKEEKKRLEQAKKEQKEKEKKEQEIRKRFKLTGLIEVIHQVNACLDYKGGKNELSVKQGDQIEIIRITDNPEGKWLARMKGCYGYIKTTTVNIDYDSLKRKKTIMAMPIRSAENDQEIYDDVEDSTNKQSAGKSGSAHFSPPPSNDDDDIYDGIDEDINVSSVPQDEEKANNWSWGLFKRMKGGDFRKKSVYEKTEKENSEESPVDLTPTTQQSVPEPDGDVYDDVDASDFPPPPIEFSAGKNVKYPTLGRSDAKDSRKLKKFEKEEKDFRKRFKYTGEIRVLSSTQVVSALTSKKWDSKDLPLKPGESLDIIQNTNENTLLCRNDEGKYGYVLRRNLIDADGEIYDDIGEDCIYDND